MKRDFYIYVIFRLDGRPCYVGKGRGRRWLQHERKTHNPHLREIIRQANGCELPKVKIREGLGSAEALEIEAALIKAIGRKDNGGPLVNLTDGGEGIINPSPELRAKRQAISKERMADPAYRERSISNLRSPSAKAKLTELRATPEYRAKLGAAHAGVTLTSEHRQNIGKAHQGRKRSSTAKAAMRASQLKRYEDPVARERMSISRKGAVFSDEHRANLSKAHMGHRRSPESIEKQRQTVAEKRRAKSDNAQS